MPIRDATYFVPLVTPAFATRQWTPWELETALAHQVRALGEELGELYRRRALLVAEGEDARALDEQVAQVKRRLRAGPQCRAGDRLGEGRFELLQELGSGGFATVWRAGGVAAVRRRPLARSANHRPAGPSGTGRHQAAHS